MVSRILLTGGLGFIGSHTAFLLSEKYEVIIFDNLYNSKLDVLDNIKKISKVQRIFIFTKVILQIKMIYKMYLIFIKILMLLYILLH